MAGRGPQTFKKRQKEQARKEKQQEKVAKRLARKQGLLTGPSDEDDTDLFGEQDSDSDESPAADEQPGTGSNAGPLSNF